MAAFELAPSRLIGDLKRHLEQAIEHGSLEPRREDAYYVAHLARTDFYPAAIAMGLREAVATAAPGSRVRAETVTFPNPNPFLQALEPELRMRARKIAVSAA